MSENINYFLETDVLVIGCGIAGGVAALQLADAGHDVTVITRTQNPKESNTYYAQGGIIYQGVNDSPALLAEDVIRAGAGRSVPHSVHILARQGPELVKEVLLERIGVPFDRNSGGELSLAREGGHSLPRIIHSADATGKAIETTIIEKLQRHPRVRLLNGYTAVDLLVSRQSTGGPACAGAYLLEQSGNRIVTCLARDTPGDRRPGSDFPTDDQPGRRPGGWGGYGLSSRGQRGRHGVRSVPSNCFLPT